MADETDFLISDVPDPDIIEIGGLDEIEPEEDKDVKVEKETLDDYSTEPVRVTRRGVKIRHEDAGKLKRGDVVEIPLEVRLVRKKKGKILLQPLQRFRRSPVIDQYTDAIDEEDDVDDIEVDYTEHEPDASPDSIYGMGIEKPEEPPTIMDDIGVEGIEYTDEDGEIEIGIEYEYKKVEMEGPMRAMAQRLGLPISETKLVGDRYERKVYPYEILYKNYQKMRVGPFGTLVPYESDKKVQLIGEDILLPLEEVEGVPDKIENPFDPQLSFGVMVEFIDEKKAPRKGIILGFDKDGIRVADAKNGDLYGITYDVFSKTGKIIPRIQKVVEQKRVYTLSNFYQQPVSTKLREHVRNMYTTALLELFPMEPDAPAPKVNQAEVIVQHSPPVSWEEFFNQEFTKWNYSRYFEPIKNSIDMTEVSHEAQKRVDDAKNIGLLISNLSNLFPDKTLSTHTDTELFEALKAQKELRPIDATLMQKLGLRLHLSRDRELTGEALGREIAMIYENYLRIHPPDIDIIFRRLMDSIILDSFHKIVPTNEEKKMFEDEFGEVLRTNYIDYVKKFTEEKTKSRPVSVKKEEKKVGIKDLIKTDVGLFENVVYEAYGNGLSTYRYLQNVLTPYIFLVGELGTMAKFFRSKIANGSFSIAVLYTANIAHFLPEIAMNKSLTQDDWILIGETLAKVLLSVINDTIYNYYTLLNPMLRVQTHPALRVTPAATLEKYLVVPQDVCYNDSKTGKIGGHAGKKTTDIPDGDLVICLDGDNFVCHSIRGVLSDITNNNSIDPVTAKPYPKEFITKMKHRYANIVQDISTEQPVVVTEEKPEEIKPPPVERPVSKEKPKPKTPEPIRTPTMHTVLVEDAPEVEPFTLFNDSIDVEGLGIYTVTTNPLTPDIDITIIVFDAGKIDQRKDKIPYIPEDSMIYILVVSDKTLNKKEKISKQYRLRKIVPKFSGVVYVDATGDREEKVRNGIARVIMDAEILKEKNEVS